MKFIKILSGIVLVASVFSCENEVEINAEFIEQTHVIGLLDASNDTHFVKISKTFLDNDLNAIQLANDPDKLYYDSILVKLIDSESKEEFILSKILRPKNDGIFTKVENQAYYTTQSLEAGKVYNLEIDRLNGTSKVKGSTLISDGISLVRPRAATNGKIVFVDFRGDINDYRFEFETTENVGEFTALMRFNYLEINNTDTIKKNFEMPVSRLVNSSLDAKKTFVTILSGEAFYDSFKASIPASPNAPKRLIPDRLIEIIIDAADGEYSLFRSVNGPIDGLSQTRPEYTNITNGLGLFSSRSQKIYEVSLGGDDKDYIVGTFGDRNDNITEYRGFAFE